MKFLNSSTKTIWRYNGFYKRKVAEEKQVFWQDKFTFLEESPLENEAKCKLLIKREDQSLAGSHKFRPISYQLASLKQDGIKYCTISSSGNAAITLAVMAPQAGIKPFIFISPSTPSGKKAELVRVSTDKNLEIFESRLALRFSNYLSKKAGIPQLRPSLDDNAVEGYKSLGFELFEQDPDIEAIFFYITSGASLIGTYEAYVQLQKDKLLKKMPFFFAVVGEQQHSALTGKCAKVKMRREKQVNKILAKTGGGKINVEDPQILNLEKRFAQIGIITSPESLAAYAAAEMVTKDKGLKKAVAIFSGKKWPLPSSNKGISNFKNISSFEELDAIIEELHNKGQNKQS